MLNVNKNGALEAPLFSEGAAGQFTISIQGSGYNNAGPRQLYVNGVARYDTAAGRGLRLTVLDYSMATLFDQVYDVYADDAAKTALATKLNETMATASRLFVITSWDAIGTNAGLTTAFTNARSTEFLRYVTAAGRFPYAAFGSSKHGILKEVCYPVDAKFPKAIIETTFESEVALGRTGYGPLLANIPDVISTTSGYGFYTKFLGYTGTGPADIWEDDFIWLKCQARVSPDRAAAGGRVAPYIYSYTSANEWARSTYTAVSNTEWTDINLFLKRDPAWVHGTSGLPEEKFYVGLYHYPSGNAVGKSEIRNLTVMRSGRGPTSSTIIDSVKISEDVISARDIRDGLPFDVFSQDSYYELYNSADNLFKGTMPANVLNGAAVAEDVTIFNRVMAAADSTILWKDSTDTTNENMQMLLPWKDIQPDTPYFAAIWHKALVKTAGTNYFGMYAGNSVGTNVASFYGDFTTTSTNNQYFTYPSATVVNSDDMIGNWRLMCGIILPESWTTEQVTAFLGPDILANPMLHRICTLRNGAPGIFKLANSTTQIRLRFLDYYNTTNKAKSYWAMPLLIPLNTLRMSKRDGITAFRLKEM